MRRWLETVQMQSPEIGSGLYVCRLKQDSGSDLELDLEKKCSFEMVNIYM